MSRWPILQMKRLRQGENPRTEGCLSAEEIRTGLIGKLTQMWVKLPQISQDGHPQILPSESIDSDVLSGDKNCVQLRGLLIATTIVRTTDPAVPPRGLTLIQALG